MSGINSRFFLDTNTVVNILQGHSVGNVLEGKLLHTSFMVELECLSKPGMAASEARLIQKFFDEEVIVHEFDSIIKAHTIDIRRSKALKVPDAIIAATAIKLNIPIVTADTDFEKITELDVVLYQP
jgi:predicted nucleic acid-binding protein